MELLIVYNANGYPTLLNDWQDKHYFTGSSPTLFLYRDGGHLAKCKMAI